MMNPYLTKTTMRMIYPNLISDGIMNDLGDFNVPWKDLDIDNELELGYYQHSAQKQISPIVFDITNNIDNIINHRDIVPITVEQRTQLAGMIYNLYRRKWAHLWSANISEYNPINNYDMTENETIENESTDRRTDTGTITNVTDTDTSQTGTVSNSGNDSRTNGIYGFNSSDSVNSDNTTGTESNTRTDNLHGTNDTTDTETHNLTISDNGTHNTERALTRRGNIGVTTTQQMLESEIKLWQWDFFKSVFEDIDAILCLDIY